MATLRWFGALTLAAALLTACSSKPPAGGAPAAPSAPATNGPGTVQMHPYGRGGWQIDVTARGWFFDWLPGGRLLLQTGIGADSVVAVDMAKGETRLWPAAPVHMMTAVSPDGSRAAWPEKDGNTYKLMVGAAGAPGQPVLSGDEDIYVIYWLSDSALLVERPSGVQHLTLGGSQPTSYPGRQVIQVNRGAALLSDPKFPGPGLLITAAGTTYPIPTGTTFGLLSPDGARLAWAPALTPPAPPTATGWLAPRTVNAHGAAAAYARELRLVAVSSGKESSVALPGSLYIDNAAWRGDGGELLVATHQSTDAQGLPKGSGLLRISPDGKIARVDPGGDYFDLGGFIGDRPVIFLGDPRDFTQMRPLALDATGARQPLWEKPVQYVDEALGPPYLSFATTGEVVMINRADGRRFVLPRQDRPKGTEIYPPQLSPDGRWLALRGEGKLYLLAAAPYAMP